MSPDTRANGTGPFVSIALPAALVAELAGARPVWKLTHDDIPGANLAQLKDAVVACLLMGGKTDALDVLAALTAAGYAGAVLVIAPPMPNPRMIERELARAAKTMKVTLLVR
ncbi:hypothetical protein G3572_02950 [Rhodobacter sp. ETT8]|uniref:Uncharacterized protein n=2 Tax=Pseudotabrizicola algicola TaxID=2709381 RepID=A0A6B3RJS4_9RHOB|nr:hypothetical protein [Pseudotabrizicola algicola]